jgi:hypothetical protein
MSLVLVALTLGLPLLGLFLRVAGTLAGCAIAVTFGPVVFVVALLRDLARRRKERG